MKRRYSKSWRILSGLFVFVFFAATGCTADMGHVSAPSDRLESSRSNALSSYDTASSSGAGGDISDGSGAYISSAAGTLSGLNETSSHKSSSKASSSGGEEPKPQETGFVQKQFYIATWRAVHFGAEEKKYTRIIKATKEVGINLIENAVLSRDDGLMSARICEQQGINFLISNITSDRGYTGMGDNVPDVSQDLVRSVVDEVKDYRYLLGYYIWDEVTPSHFSTCRTIKKYFNKYDPQRLAFSLVFPSYGAYKWHLPDGTIENSQYYKYVTDYIKEVDPDVLSMDYYALKSYNTSLVQNDLWRDMGLFRLKSMETGKPFWWYFQGYDMADGTVGHMTREKLAVQMFSGIAYGAKAVSYFQSLGALTTEFGEKTSLYEDAKSLHVEVQNVGNLLFDKKSMYLYHFGISQKLKAPYFLDDPAQSDVIVKAPDKTIVSIFGDGKKAQYIMVVNKDYSNPVNGSLSFRSELNVDEYNKKNNTFTRLFDNALSVYINIKPGDCAVYRIS